MSHTPPTPIVIFAYKRKEHLERLFRSLKKNDSLATHPIIVFVDGSKNSSDVVAQKSVVEFLQEKQSIHKFDLHVSPQNQGLSKSIIQGVSSVFKTYDRAIVLEDDLELAPYALQFFEDCLNQYGSVREVGSITGYAYPIPSFLFGSKSVYLAHRASSWGWATWKDRWEEVDWSVADYEDFKKDPIAIAGFNRGGLDLDDMLHSYMEGKIDSWAVRWAYYHFKSKRYCLHPTRALIQNTGVDGSGTHCEPTDFFDNSISYKKVRIPPKIAFRAYFAALQTLYLNSRFTDLIGRKEKIISQLLFKSSR